MPQVIEGQGSGVVEVPLHGRAPLGSTEPDLHPSW